MLTICIPTLDRPAFLKRLLRYYAAMHFPGWILIGDSSAEEHARDNREAVAMFQGHLKLVYQECPGLSSCEAVEQLSQMVSTPYCVLQGDDDFLCPGGLERCVTFLGAHSDYVAAHGKALRFQTESNSPHGPIGTVASYPQAVVESPTGSQRLLELLTVGPYALLNSVHRTPIWRAMFRGLAAMNGVRNRNVFKDELMAACVSVIYGKVKELDGLSLIRQTHTETSYRFPHLYDWIMDSAWFPSYQIFYERLVEELIRQDGVSREQAHAVIRRGCWTYLSHDVMTTWRKEQARGSGMDPSRLRAWAKRIPGLRGLVRAVRFQVQRACDANSLPALLHPSSPYHGDFLPVYSVVTNESTPVMPHQVTADAKRDPAIVGAE